MNASDDSTYDHGKAIDEISKQVHVNSLSHAPMIERADASPTPSHIDIVVPTNPSKSKKKPEQMTRKEIANTMMWAHKDDIDYARLPHNSDMQLQTQNMNRKEKSDLFHQVVDAAEQENAEAADPSIVPVTNA